MARFEVLAERGLAVALVVAPLAIGAVHQPMRGVLEASLAALGFIAVGTGRCRLAASRAIALPAAVLGAWILCQAIPLPRAVLEWTSPRAAWLQALAVPIIGEASRPLAIDPRSAFDDARLYLAMAIAAWLAATARRPGDLLRAIAVAGTAVAVVGVAQHLTWNGKLLWFFEPFDGGSYYPRLQGPFVNPDHFALFLELASLPTLGWTVWRLRRGGRGFGADVVTASFAVVVMLAGLVGSASRGAVVAVVVGAAVLVALLVREDRHVAEPRRARGRRARVERWLGRVSALGLVGGTLLVAVLYAGPRARSLLDARVGQLSAGGDQEFRVDLVRTTVAMIRDFALCGVGLGGWKDLYPRYRPFTLAELSPRYAHDDYLEWTAEVGIPGAIVTAVIALAWIRRVLANRSLPRPVCAGILAGLAACAVHETIDFGLRIPANALLAAVLVGLGCNQRWRGEPPEAPPSSRAALALAAALLVAFSWTAARDVRDSLAWAAADAGATLDAPDEASADTWLAVARARLLAAPTDGASAGAALRAAIVRRVPFAEAWRVLALVETQADTRVELLRTAIALDVTRVDTRIALALDLDRRGRSAEALREIEDAVAANPRFERHPWIAGRAHELPAEVRASVERGLRRSADAPTGDVAAVGASAGFAFMIEDYDDAARWWTSAAEEQQRWSPAGRFIAASLLRAGRHAEAEAAAERAIHDDPTDAENYEMLGSEVLPALRRLDDARRVLQTGIERSTDPPRLWLALYRLESSVGERSRALVALERGAEAAPRDADAQLRLGRARLEDRDFHRALVAFERAAKIAPERSEAHAGLAEACASLYRLDCAQRAYAAAAGLEPRNATYAKRLEQLSQAFSGRAASVPGDVRTERR